MSDNSASNERTLQIGWTGIIAGFFAQDGFRDKVNNKLAPYYDKDMAKLFLPGQVLQALICIVSMYIRTKHTLAWDFTGLARRGNPLCLFGSINNPQGKPYSPEDFNDEVVRAFCDALVEYGPARFYNEVAADLLKPFAKFITVARAEKFSSSFSHLARLSHPERYRDYMASIDLYKWDPWSQIIPHIEEEVRSSFGKSRGAFVQYDVHQMLVLASSPFLPGTVPIYMYAEASPQEENSKFELSNAIMSEASALKELYPDLALLSVNEKSFNQISASGCIQANLTLSTALSPKNKLLSSLTSKVEQAQLEWHKIKNQEKDQELLFDCFNDKGKLDTNKARDVLDQEKLDLISANAEGAKKSGEAGLHKIKDLLKSVFSYRLQRQKNHRFMNPKVYAFLSFSASDINYYRWMAWLNMTMAAPTPSMIKQAAAYEFTLPKEPIPLQAVAMAGGIDSALYQGEILNAAYKEFKELDGQVGDKCIYPTREAAAAAYQKLQEQFHFCQVILLGDSFGRNFCKVRNQNGYKINGEVRYLYDVLEAQQNLQGLYGYVFAGPQVKLELPEVMLLNDCESYKDALPSAGDASTLVAPLFGESEQHMEVLAMLINLKRLIEGLVNLDFRVFDHQLVNGRLDFFYKIYSFDQLASILSYYNDLRLSDHSCIVEVSLKQKQVVSDLFKAPRFADTIAPYFQNSFYEPYAQDLLRYSEPNYADVCRWRKFRSREEFESDYDVYNAIMFGFSHYEHI